MPAILLLVVLLVPLLAGCVPGSTARDGIPSPDAPLTLTALDVGQSTFPFRGMGPASSAHSQHGAVLPCMTGALSRTG
jgi:hypothetical protein